MACLEAAVLTDTDSPGDPHPLPSVLPDLQLDSSHRRPLEVQGMTHEKAATLQKSHLMFLIYTDRNPGNAQGLTVKETKLHQASYRPGRTNRCSAFRAAAQTITKSSNIGSLAETWTTSGHSKRTRSAGPVSVQQRKGFKGLGRLGVRVDLSFKTPRPGRVQQTHLSPRP